MTPEDFDRWVHAFHVAVDEAPSESTFGVGVDQGDEELAFAAGEESESAAILAEFDRLVAGSTRQVAFMVTKVMWSPTPDGESSPAWATVTVGRDLPARFEVRRLEEDKQWWVLDIEDVPWFMLSTASGLRRSLDGQPITLKAVDDRVSLFKTPAQASPELDDDGLL